MRTKELGGAGDAPRKKVDRDPSNNQNQTPAQGFRHAVHPAAELFPPMDGTELKDLADDIKKNGLISPIVYIKGSGILDGRNRLAACRIAGITPRWEAHTDKDPVAKDPVAFVISANIHRRHLNAEQKRELIAKLLKLDPGKSDRQIAAVAKAHHGTVASERRKAEGRGEISHVAKRTDAKGRKQPATKTTTIRAKVRDVTVPIVAPYTVVDSAAAGNDVDTEASAEQRKAEMAALDTDPRTAEDAEAGKDIASAKQLVEFKVACDIRLPNMNPLHRREALAYCTMKAGAATESPPPAMETVH